MLLITVSGGCRQRKRATLTSHPHCSGRRQEKGPTCQRNPSYRACWHRTAWWQCPGEQQVVSRSENSLIPTINCTATTQLLKGQNQTGGLKTLLYQMRLSRTGRYRISAQSQCFIINIHQEDTRTDLVILVDLPFKLPEHDLWRFWCHDPELIIVITLTRQQRGG